MNEFQEFSSFFIGETFFNIFDNLKHHANALKAVIISSVRAIFSGIILLPVGALQVTLVSYSTTAVSQLCMKF